MCVFGGAGAGGAVSEFVGFASCFLLIAFLVFGFGQRMLMMMIKRQERCQGSQESYAAHADNGSGGVDDVFDSGGIIGVFLDRATGRSEASGGVLGGTERKLTLDVRALFIHSYPLVSKERFELGMIDEAMKNLRI